MKVVFVLTRSDVMGGASVHTLDLASGLQARGYDITILVGGQGVFLEYARDRALNCISLKYMIREIDPVADLKAISELRIALKRLKPDLIHLHSSKAGVIGRLGAVGLAAPCIFTAHGWAFTEGVSPRRRLLYRVIERLMAPLASRIITVSHYDKNLALAEQVARPNQLVVIHNGMPDIPTDMLARQGSTSDIVRFVMVARFDTPKDHASLLRAFASLPAENWRLELIGDGPQMQAVIALATFLGLANKVIFSGACTDVSSRLANSDVFVLVSHWEGLPLTILEAMRAGLPVIASDVGGVAEAVLEGETGYLIKRGSNCLLIQRLGLLIADVNRRRFMGAAGRRRYESGFTFSSMLDKTIAVYEEVLS